ncbi:hypothetical protein HAX54_015726, partial [Datura stramonium]|nr:hypothetical protein [Datura stramonium]
GPLQQWDSHCSDIAIMVEVLPWKKWRSNHLDSRNGPMTSVVSPPQWKGNCCSRRQESESGFKWELQGFHSIIS